MYLSFYIYDIYVHMYIYICIYIYIYIYIYTLLNMFKNAAKIFVLFLDTSVMNLLPHN